MIRACNAQDFEDMYVIINEAAEAYRGVIPQDCWKDPYMPKEELRAEIEAHVVFWGFEDEGALIGVMGLQEVQDVSLIRHAYVRTLEQNRGVGKNILTFLRARTTRPLLVGTWADAKWAIRFYEKHGFRLVTPKEKDMLLRRYWSISDRQIETSVVLADEKWRSLNKRE